MRLDDIISERWSKKYKRGIDCSRPKGFSQRAHCAGRKKRQRGMATSSGSVSESVVDNPLNERSTRTSSSGAPGTLKAKITKLYGGGITCSKTERLKKRRGATAHDKAQANWYQNKHCGGASKTAEDIKMDKQSVHEDDLDEVYPGQSSGRLKNYIAKKYGGEISCRKVSMLLNDPDVTNFYKKRASWYKSLHCKGVKQIRETDPSQSGAALTIWDIDDTLFETSAKVIVRKADGSEVHLTSAEWNAYKKEPGDEIDFSQFKDSKLFHDTSKPIKNMWKTAKRVLENIGKRPGSRMVIVTARGDFDDRDLFLNTFEKHGMDMSKVHVYRAGNMPSGSSAERKKVIIREILDAGDYTEVRLFDDHEQNLRAFLELKLEFPELAFKAFPVGKQGVVGRPVIL